MRYVNAAGVEIDVPEGVTVGSAWKRAKDTPEPKPAKETPETKDTPEPKPAKD